MDFDGTSLQINFHQKKLDNKKINNNFPKITNNNPGNIKSETTGKSFKRRNSVSTGNTCKTDVFTRKIPKLPPTNLSNGANRGYRPFMSVMDKVNEQDIRKNKPTNQTNIPKNILFDKDINLDSIKILNENLKNALKSYLNSNQLTVVQRLAWPIILDGHNVLIKSPSGTGKTLAFLTPIIEKLINKEPKVNRKDGTYAIILVPTKELAKQISDILTRILRNFIWIVPGGLFGCDKRKAEKMRIRKGLNIIVATPGRLHDHLVHTKCLGFEKLEWFVVDEADLLLDMGYEKKFQEIKNCIPNYIFSKCQKIFLSATLSKKFSEFFSVLFDENTYFVDAANERVSLEKNISNIDPIQFQYVEDQSHEMEYPTDMMNSSEFNYPANLKQQIIETPTKFRLITLVWYLKYIFKMKGMADPNTNVRIIIFFSSIASADFHCQLSQLIRNEIQSASMDMNNNPIKFLLLHGSMQIKERIHIYESFSRCNKSILFTTDVAARGLDFPLVDWIIQFSPAREIKEYVHRVGRTCRIGNTGNAVLFLESHEMSYMDLLYKSHLIIEQVTLKSLYSKIGGDIKKLEEDATLLFKLIREAILNNGLYDLALSAYNSTIKAYASYPKMLKSIFCLKNLHLGHLAESFTIRESPKEIFEHIRGSKKGVEPKKRIKPINDKPNFKIRMPIQVNRGVLKSASALLLDEFKGGIVRGPQSKTSKKN